MKQKNIFDNLISEISNYDKYESLTEGLIVERRLDSVIRKLVKDIVYTLKKQQEGSFELPSELYPEQLLYSFTQFSTEFTLELNIEYSDKVFDFKMDANYFKDEDVFEVNLVVNPEKLTQNLQKIIGPLNELIAHELTHLKQFERGDELPSDEPDGSLNYYMQQHELEAQYKGFNRRAKKEKRSLDSVMDDWFKENEEIHNLSKKEVTKLKNAIKKWPNV